MGGSYRPESVHLTLFREIPHYHSSPETCNFSEYLEDSPAGNDTRQVMDFQTDDYELNGLNSDDTNLELGRQPRIENGSGVCDNMPPIEYPLGLPLNVGFALLTFNSFEIRFYMN
jgi:hypothetical protein